MNRSPLNSSTQTMLRKDALLGEDAAPFVYGETSTRVQLSPYVLNGPEDQRSFHDELISIQQHDTATDIPWEVYQRRLSLVAAADFTTAQASLEAPKATAKSWSSNYGTHGWHRYVGRFPPHLVRALLNHFRATKEDVVLDPFSGSGTTLVECRLLGIPAVGVEICPLSAMMSRVKASFPEATIDLTRTICDLEVFYAERWQQFLNGRSLTSVNHAEVIQRSGNLVEPFTNYERWLTVEALLGVSIAVEFAATISGYLRDAVVLALSSKMRSIGNVDVDVVRAEYSKEPRRNVDVLRLVSGQLRKMVLAIQQSVNTHQGLMGQPTSVQVLEGDVRDVLIPDGSISHVITSPPYGVEAISYLRTHLLSYRCLKVFLGADPYNFGKNVIGSEYIRDQVHEVHGLVVTEASPTLRAFFGQPALTQEKKLITRTMMMLKFFDDMHQVAVRLQRWMQPGGRMAFVIGNNKIGTTVVPTDVIMQEIFDATGFDTDRVLGHKLKSNNSNSQVPWQDRVIQDEFVMLLRRRP